MAQNPQPPKPPNRPQTILHTLTRVVQAVQAKVDFSKLSLKPGAKVPELRVHDESSQGYQTYPLLGEVYKVGRSSKCDIVTQSSIVSQHHLSIRKKDSAQPRSPFIIKDENSTNGVFYGKRRLKKPFELRHGDVLTLGPPELSESVALEYYNPPPAYITTLRYGLYGFTGVTALVAAWILAEWQRIPVRPLPPSVQGPVVVYARDGETPLRQTRTSTHGEMRRLSEFSSYLPKAVVASEDSRYYWHLGVDPLGIARALVTNIRGGEIREGGSTVSQQLARSLFRDYVGTEDSASRKIREAIVALKLETFYSKDYLLLMYLNRVFLGNDHYGFEDAAQFYFGKSASDLTLSEAATLVGMLPAPNSFNPIQDYETAIGLRNRVLNRMVMLGMVSQEEAQQARRSRIDINPEAIQELRGTLAPYFYAQVFRELEDLLGQDLAREGNFIVETALSLDLQSQAEDSLTSAIATTGQSLGFSQGAVITLDIQTGAVVALVGGTDYRESQFNRATQAQRQPGSTFKVFAYAAALEQGISPNQTFACSPLTWQGQQFAGCRSGGAPVDMYRGMARSENVVALRIAQDVGLNSVIEMARRLGIQSPLIPAPGLILGQSEVSLIELTGAFNVLANDGVKNPPHLITRVLDSSDCSEPGNRESCRVIYDSQSILTQNQVISSQLADRMTGLLQGVIQGGTGRNAYVGVGEAGKTGTTDDNVDSWFVGYIPRIGLTTGVWLGNDDNSPTGGSSAQAAQIWGRYMNQVVQ
ncbi:MAG: PBP1A family penicillin-binding protein [Leptolyngbyaceae bacterium]|nr:PBP1A family penicillin-binding protein [Leptolyngbyaceae bacterium]